MTVRRLLTMLQAVDPNSVKGLRSNQTLEPEAETNGFLLQGEIQVARADGTYEVNITSTGERQPMTGMTDEPLEQGMLVWVSKTNGDSWVVHGSVK